MHDPRSEPDDENPEFDFKSARRWRPGDPTVSEAVRLRRVLEKIRAAAAANDAKTCHRLAAEALDQ